MLGCGFVLGEFDCGLGVFGGFGYGLFVLEELSCALGVFGGFVLLQDSLFLRIFSILSMLDSILYA